MVSPSPILCKPSQSVAPEHGPAMADRHVTALSSLWCAASFWSALVPYRRRYSSTDFRFSFAFLFSIPFAFHSLSSIFFSGDWSHIDAL
jgi:hypothetical protein